MLGAFWPYLRFVCSTSTWAHAPADHLGTVKRNQPVIIALWHGQTMLLPEVLLFEIRPSAKLVTSRAPRRRPSASISSTGAIGRLAEHGPFKCRCRRSSTDADR